jgi:ribosomal protein S21
MQNEILVDNYTYKTSEAVQAKPLEVKVYNDKNFDKALKAFRALVQKEKILSIYKESLVYEKPSDRKRRKRNEFKRKLIELEFEKEMENKKQKKGKKYQRNSNWSITPP